MSYKTPDEIRAKLTTAFGREAFDTLNALGPRWIAYEQEGERQVYLMPTIEIKEVGGNFRHGVGPGYAATFDEAVAGTLRALQEAASASDTLVIINAEENRAEFVYDKSNAVFTPYKPA